MISYTLQIMLIGTALLGGITGALSVFITLRKQSLLGDAISHAALPGIAAAFLATYTNNPSVLLVGGAITGSIGALLVTIINRFSKLKQDTAIGIVLSVFFGFGLVLMTVIQKEPVAHQAVLGKFLFGNATTFLIEDLWNIAIIGGIVCSILYTYSKEFSLIAFDETYAHTIGYRVWLLDIVLVSALVLVAVLGLQTVGVVLMSSLLIAPASAARQWTNNLNIMLFVSILIGMSSSVGGAIISSWYDRMPTGPVIVVLLSFIVLISMICTQRHKQSILPPDCI